MNDSNDKIQVLRLPENEVPNGFKKNDSIGLILPEGVIHIPPSKGLMSIEDVNEAEASKLNAIDEVTLIHQKIDTYFKRLIELENTNFSSLKDHTFTEESLQLYIQNYYKESVRCFHGVIKYAKHPEHGGVFAARAYEIWENLELNIIRTISNITELQFNNGLSDVNIGHFKLDLDITPLLQILDDKEILDSHQQMSQMTLMILEQFAIPVEQEEPLFNYLFQNGELNSNLLGMELYLKLAKRNDHSLNEYNAYIASIFEKYGSLSELGDREYIELLEIVQEGRILLFFDPLKVSGKIGIEIERAPGKDVGITKYSNKQLGRFQVGIDPGISVEETRTFNQSLDWGVGYLEDILLLAKFYIYTANWGEGFSGNHAQYNTFSLHVHLDNKVHKHPLVNTGFTYRKNENSTHEMRDMLPPFYANSLAVFQLAHLTQFFIGMSDNGFNSSLKYSLNEEDIFMAGVNFEEFYSRFLSQYYWKIADKNDPMSKLISFVLINDSHTFELLNIHFLRRILEDNEHRDKFFSLYFEHLFENKAYKYLSKLIDINALSKENLIHLSKIIEATKNPKSNQYQLMMRLIDKGVGASFFHHFATFDFDNIADVDLYNVLVRFARAGYGERILQNIRSIKPLELNHFQIYLLNELVNKNSDKVMNLIEDYQFNELPDIQDNEAVILVERLARKGAGQQILKDVKNIGDLDQFNLGQILVLAAAAEGSEEVRVRILNELSAFELSGINDPKLLLISSLIKDKESLDSIISKIDGFDLQVLKKQYKITDNNRAFELSSLNIGRNPFLKLYLDLISSDLVDNDIAIIPNMSDVHNWDSWHISILNLISESIYSDKLLNSLSRFLVKEERKNMNSIVLQSVFQILTRKNPQLFFEKMNISSLADVVGHDSYIFHRMEESGFDVWSALLEIDMTNVSFEEMSINQLVVCGKILKRDGEIAKRKDMFKDINFNNLTDGQARFIERIAGGESWRELLDILGEINFKTMYQDKQISIIRMMCMNDEALLYISEMMEAQGETASSIKFITQGIVTPDRGRIYLGGFAELIEDGFEEEG